jgi:hypothetical protein
MVFSSGGLGAELVRNTMEHHGLQDLETRWT